MKRRDFLVSTGAALAAWPLARRPRLVAGLQLYTVRELMRHSVPHTLELVASYGYGEVEFAGYFGLSPEDTRQLLEAHGLAAPATHVDFTTLETEWDSVLTVAQAIGHRWVVVPWIPAERRRSAADYEAVADLFERAGAAARAAGLRFAYHNHAYGVTPEGRRGLDILIERTTPENVDFELDLYWLARDGGNALDYFARFPDRFPLTHVKDMDAQGRMVDVGMGTIDFRAIIARAAQGGVRHWFVEHDAPPDVRATLRRGVEYLAGCCK